MSISSNLSNLLYKKDLFGKAYTKVFVLAVSKVLLDCTRFSLGLSINTRGWIIGPAILFVDGKVHINCRSKVKLSLC